MNTDNHPFRDESDHEKVEYDKSAKCYPHDSDDLHSKENTPVARCLTVESRPLHSKSPGQGPAALLGVSSAYSLNLLLHPFGRGNGAGSLVNFSYLDIAVLA